MIESNKSGHQEIDFSENAIRGIAGDGQVDNESNLVEIHHPVLPALELGGDIEESNNDNNASINSENQASTTESLSEDTEDTEILSEESEGSEDFSQVEVDDCILKEYSKFKAEAKIVKSAMKKWCVVSQSSTYISNVLVALVPRLICSDTWVDNLDACDLYDIPTMDGYVCNLKSKAIRKRVMTDYYSKTFHVNRPGSNTEYYEEMKEFIDNFACGRKSLADFLVKTWGHSLTMDMSSKLVYFYLGTDGDNCKSQVRKLLNGVCGDFATSLNKDMLVGRKGDTGKATT